MKSGLDLARCASRKYAPTEVPDLKSWSPTSYEPCVSSFLTELPRFDNSQNVKMRDTRDLPRFYYSFRNHTSMFSQFRKRGNDSSTPLPYRAARCFTRKPIFRFFDSGGVMSSRIASKTTLNCAWYFFSRVSSLRARSR